MSESPPGKRQRPGSPTETLPNDTTPTTKSLRSVREGTDIALQLRRRRATSWRCPPLPCGRRDPLDLAPVPDGTPKPSTFGLDERELRAHARDLYRDGWPLDEILSVLDVEPVIAR